MDSVNLRLKRLRESARPKLSIRGLGELLGIPGSTYAAYEDPAKFKKPLLPLDLARRIASILAERGVPKTAVLELAGLSTALMPAELQAGYKLTVFGEVAAGVWREQSCWPEEDQFEIDVGPPPFQGAERFAVKMVGRSMDRVIMPGSILECLRVQFGVVDPEPGQIVIVERHNHGLTEMTCKRLARDGDEWVLQFESHLPEFQGEIRLGRPSEDLYVDDEIHICGIVLKATQSLV